MTSGEWIPGRLREARCALIDHGRTVSQERFGAMVGVSKRTIERLESTHEVHPPKPETLFRILEATPPTVTPPDLGALDLDGDADFERAVGHLVIRAFEAGVNARLTDITNRVAEIERRAMRGVS